MKRLIILIVMVVLGVGVLAQRPVQSRQRVDNGVVNSARKARDNSGVRVVNSNSVVYTYTISEMSVPNVTVSDATINVTYQKPDKVKVTVNEPIEGLTYYVYDANNMAVTKGSMKGSTLCIDFKNYQPGEYRLQLLCEKDSQKNYRVVKR